MKYKQARLGRIFVLRFDHSDDIVKMLKRFAAKERIKSASVTFLGAVEKGRIVAGPKKLKLPAEPVMVTFEDGREILGFGIISKKGKAYHTHIHVSLGKKLKVLTGCLRGTPKVFITVEAVLIEFKGISISRTKNTATGHELLSFGRGERSG